MARTQRQLVLQSAARGAAKKRPTLRASAGAALGRSLTKTQKLKREDELLDKKFEMEKKLMGLRPRAAGKPYTPVLDAYEAAYLKNLDKYEDDDAKAIKASNDYIKRTFGEDQVRRESQQLHSTIFMGEEIIVPPDPPEGAFSKGVKAAGRGIHNIAKANLKYNPLINPSGAIRGAASLLRPQPTQFAPPSNIPAMGSPPNALAAPPPPQPVLPPPGAKTISPEEFKLLVESGSTPEQIRAEGFIVGR